MRQSLFGVGLQGKSPNVSAQRRVNLYLEFRPEEDGIRIVAHGTPGLTLFVDFGDTLARGAHVIGTLLYIVHRGTLWEVNNAGVKTNRGTLLTTTGRVYMTDNGTTLMITDGTYGWTYNTSTLAFAQITDVDFPAPSSVTWQDRYYIVSKAASGRFYISAPDDPTSWNALDFANAEGNPDNLVRLIADHGELILLGDVTTEFWGDSGAADFPFARQGSAVVEWGLAAAESLAKFDSSLMFLGRNRMGECQVVMLNGYTPTNVGSQDFLDAINKYSTVNDATAWSYMNNGHAFYQINFPTAGKSWLYDGATKVWSELQDATFGRHRANLGVFFINNMVVADYSNGKVYRLDKTVYTDNGAMIPRKIISRHLISDKYTPIGQLWIDMEQGVGTATGQGVLPQAMLRVSEDRGHTWSNEIWRDFGAIGDFQQRALWNRLGSAYSWTLELSITDPVKVAIMSEGWVNT